MSNVAIAPPRRAASAIPGRCAATASRRRAAIARYQILDTASEVDFDNITRLAAQVFGAPFAAISFIDDDRRWFKAQHGLGVRETPIGQSFCAFAIRQNTAFIVNDATRDARFADNALVTGAPHIRFYAGMKIVADDGTPIASLCVLDSLPRSDGISETELLTLQVLAAQVQSLLELRRAVIVQRSQVMKQSALSDRLRHVAEHDALTGLPQRGLFHRKLTSALQEADRDHYRVAVMLVDIDHFKQINDALGHDVGDALLRSFAKRLRGTLRSSDIVARLGGDEFGIILTGIDKDEELSAIVRSLNDRLRAPVKHNGRMVECRASIGIAVYPNHANCTRELIKCSDLALTTAKLARGSSAVFCSTMTEQFERETEMLSVARVGINAHRIVPHYQPKVDLGTGRIVGFEALARCSTQAGAVLLPEAFEHAFGDRELACLISAQMLSQVLGDMRSWLDCGILFGRIAINTCAADFYGDDFAERLLEQLEHHQIAPQHLEIEVTEGVFLGRGAHFVGRALSRLSKSGVRIALDDFGTGFAALTHLKQFPVDILKIDRSFVAGIGKNPDDTAIVRAVIGLGASLGIETVAEGLETSEQVNLVRSHGCDVGQGFYYSHARPASAVPRLLNGNAAKAELQLTVGA